MALLVAGVVLLAAPGGALATVITPTTTADVVVNDGKCSLREAISVSSGPLTHTRRVRFRIAADPRRR